MQDVKIKRTVGINGLEAVFEAKDIDYINESMLKMLFETPGAEVMGTLTEKKRRKFGMRNKKNTT